MAAQQGVPQLINGPFFPPVLTVIAPMDKGQLKTKEDKLFTEEAPKYKCFLKVDDETFEFHFHTREPAIRFKDILAKLPHSSWSFDMKEEAKIWKNM